MDLRGYGWGERDGAPASRSTLSLEGLLRSASAALPDTECLARLPRGKWPTAA